MRTLFLIRHAKSSWDHPGLRDIDRPLNGRGQSDAPKMAQLLKKQGIEPDLVVSSPAKRAFSTALIFAGTLGVPDEKMILDPNIYEAVPNDILRIISRLPENAHTVLLFGHNPTFTELANRFSDSFIDNVPTCGIVQIESTAPDWQSFYEGNARVRAYFFPKEYL